MAAPAPQKPKSMRGFYFFALTLGLASIWMSGWVNPGGDVLGKIISSVILLILCFIILLTISWIKSRKRKQKIRNAVLSPRP